LKQWKKEPERLQGAKVDILFKVCKDEIGSCEVGNYCVTIVDDKYLDDGLMNLPKTLRDMLSVLVQKNPAQANHLKTVGFLIAGKQKILQ
jgi:hypothetical protein